MSTPMTNSAPNSGGPLFKLQENVTLTVTTNASVYLPTQNMKIRANFTYENGTAIDAAVTAFYFQGPNLEPLGSKGNVTDSNGISTAEFFIKANYLDGNYTVYVTATKGAENASKTIYVIVNATYIQITMYPPILIGDTFNVDAYYGFTNGTPIANALCTFLFRNASKILGSKSDFTDVTGVATQSFGTIGYAEGWYEMYVTALKGNYTKVANRTFFITAYDGPIILDPTLTPDPPAYNESSLVNVSIGVAPGYANITGAKLSFYNGTGWYNLTMTNSTPIDWRGFAYYDASIPPHNYNLQISYKIWSIDSLGNQSWNDNGGQLFNYTVGDRWGPTVDDPTWTTPITYNTTVNVTVRIREDPLSPTVPSSIFNASLFYQFGAIPVEILMSQLNGTLRDGYWTGLIPTLSYGTNVDFWIQSFDSAGNPTVNNNGGANFSYTVDDFWGPTISNILLNNAPIAYNMTANITCRVQEPTVPALASGIDEVILGYHDGLGWNNISMTWTGGTPYDSNYQAFIPEIQYGTTVLYYIWCNDTAGNPTLDNNSGSAYPYFVNDFTPPNISSVVVANAPIAYPMPTNVTCLIQELSVPTVQSTVDTPILIYRENGGSWINLTMNRYSGNAADGWYSAEIPPLDYGTLVEYWIWCNDTAGNTAYNDNSSNYYSYVVDDFAGPSISAITVQNAPIAYTMQANITVRIQEDTVPTLASGVDTVILSYNDGGGWVNVSMNRYVGNQYDGYYAALIPEHAYNTLVQYWIWCNDSAGNPSLDNNSGLAYSYVVDDFLSPSISAVTLQNPPIFYNKTANITCRVQEPTAPANAAGVHTVILMYNDGTDHNLTMTRYIGDQYDGYYTALIPEIAFGTSVNYWVWCNDSANNPSSSGLGNYVPLDPWGPTISAILIQNLPIAYNMTANVTCRVQEPTIPANAAGVDTVILIYDNGGGWTNITMTRYTGNQYDGYYTALVPEADYGQNVLYWIWCNDSAGNPSFDDNSGFNYLYVVDDLWGPTISAITVQNAPIPYNMSANVTCRVVEPSSPTQASGVQTVTLYYRVDGAGWNTIGMTRYTGDIWDGQYSALIPSNAYGSTIEYYVWCDDQDGNTNTDDNNSNYYSYIVDDFWGPTISAINVQNAPIAYNMTANVTVRIQEPTNSANVSTVILIYNVGAGPNNVTMNRYSGDAYDGQYTGLIPSQIYGTPVLYWIWCNDSAGNPSLDNNSGIGYPYTVDDFWGPTINNPTQNDTTVEYTEVVEVSVQIIEVTTASGVQIASVYLSYWAGSSWTNISMSLTVGDNFDGNYSATIPSQPYGTEVAYKIYASDIAGNPALNDNSTNLFNYTVTDLTAPTINLINPANETIIAGMAQFTIDDISVVDADVNNITIVYRYNSSSWTIHGSYLSATGNLTWNPGSTTSFLVNLSSWVPGSNYTVYALAQDLRGLVSAPSYIYNITVSNYTGPLVYNILHTPDPVGYNESSVVSCTVLVPAVMGDLDTILLNYSAGVGWNIVPMTNTTPRTSGAPIDFDGAIPQFALGTVVSYWIFANDTNGNVTNADNYGAYYSYTVGDKWGPIVSAVNIQDLPVTYIEIPTIDCRVEEPVIATGVDQVILVYDNGTGWFNQPMGRIAGDIYVGDYQASIPQAPYGTLIQFYIQANDTAGNIRIDDNGGAYYSFTIADIWGPTISEITITSLPVGFNETGDISCRVNETPGAAGVDFVILQYNNGTGWFSLQMSRYSGNSIDGQYSASIPQAPFGTTVQFWIWANDTDNNVGIADNGSNYYSYIVVDFSPPAVVANLVADVYIGAQTINISWSPNGELDLSHYQIHRQNVTAVGFTPTSANNIANTTGTFYLDTGLADGVAFFYIVLAADYSGLNSTPSSIVNGTPESSVNVGAVIEIHSNIKTRLNITDADLYLDFTATSSFNLSVYTINTSYAFADHHLLMSFYINISTFGATPTVTGTMTLTLDASIIAALGSTIDDTTFAIYYWDGDSWEKLSSVYYASNQTLVATITHFSVFGAFASVIPSPPEGFPIWIIGIIIGAAIGAIAVIVLAKRKKVVPTIQVIKRIKTLGHVKIEEIAKEFNMANSQVIDIILATIAQKELRGFITKKKKQFYTADYLKEELNKLLEGD